MSFLSEGETMSENNIVILVTHGMGKQDKKPIFSKKYKTIFEKSWKKFAIKVKKNYLKGGGNVNRLIFAPVNWASITQAKQTLLGDSLMKKKHRLVCEDGRKIRAALGWKSARRFMLDFLSDAIVYQQSKNDQAMYNSIHERFSQALSKAVEKAGSDAQLVVYAHSLGTIIINNFLFDLEICREDEKADCGATPLESGKTLKRVYTTGCPYALWSIRHQTDPPFGKPLAVEKWINFYSKNDLLSYPLGNLNEKYRKIRCNGKLIDKKVLAGGLLLGWGPLSHNGYKTNRKVIKTIVDDLLTL